MAQRHYYFLVVFLLMFIGEIFGQESPQIGQQKTFQQLMGKMNYEQGLYGHAPLFVRNEILEVGMVNTSRQLVSFDYSWSLIRPSGYSFNIPPKFYTQSLGFFCQKEFQIQKITKKQIVHSAPSLSHSPSSLPSPLPVLLSTTN